MKMPLPLVTQACLLLNGLISSEPAQWMALPGIQSVPFASILMPSP